MTRAIRHAGRLVCDLARYGYRSGRWWFPVVLVVLAVAVTVAATAKVAVPTVVYALF